jgi:hypothetical protein
MIFVKFNREFRFLLDIFKIIIFLLNTIEIITTVGKMFIMNSEGGYCYLLSFEIYEILPLRFTYTIFNVENRINTIFLYYKLWIMIHEISTLSFPLNFVSSSQVRVPSWTDRILYKIEDTENINATLHSYQSMDDIHSSDHKPVKAHLCLKLI